jgi:DNA mismatch repair ATPase MutS
MAVLARAREVLAELEAHHLNMPARPEGKIRKPKLVQFSLFAQQSDPVLDSLRELDVDRMTAEEVVEMVRRWQREVGN